MNSRVKPEMFKSVVSTTEEALGYFDELHPMAIDEMLGKWRGSGFATGHPMDGLLESFDWWGKEFVSAEHVHPLVFNGLGGKTVTLDPLWMPLKYARSSPLSRNRLTQLAFRALTPVMQTRESRARLRMLEYRGKVSATMVYDAKPIHDIFRKIDDDTVLGLMDLKGMEEPFFFMLERHR